MGSPRAGAARKLTGKEQALLVATACAGHRRDRRAGRWSFWPVSWSVTEHTALSRETVRRRLLENELEPWRKEMWCSPTQRIVEVRGVLRAQP